MSWPLVKLSEVAEIFNGKTPSKKEQRESGFPVLKIKNISDKGLFKGVFESFVDESLADKFKSKKIKLDDTLILNAAHNADYVGNKQYRAQKTVVGSLPTGEWLLARAIEEQLCPRFLNYWLRSSETRFKMKLLVKGIHLYPKDVARLEIPLPPLDEQKRIAEILDKADAIRRKRQQAIQLADDFLRSVFLDMFGDPVTNPKGWDVELLGEHIQHANNGLSRRRKIEENIGDIVLRLQDVHYEGIRFGKELNRIELEDKEKSRYRLDIGDLLFIRVNGNPEYVGRSAVFEGFNEEVFHNDHLIRIKVKDSFNSRFLSYMLNLPGGKKIISSKTKTSAGQHTISQGGIESLEFIVPPIDLQNKFVNIQSTVNKQLNKQSVSFIELTHSFSSLSQKAFAGEL